MSTVSTTKQVFFLFRWLAALWALLSGLWRKAKKFVGGIFDFVGSVFMAPFNFVGWIIVSLWNLIWNFVGCNAIIIFSVIIVVALAMVPGPGWFALGGFALIYGLTTLTWLFRRAVREEIRNERRAKWITFIGVSSVLLTFGATLPFILLGWFAYKMLKPRMMRRMSNFDGHHG